MDLQLADVERTLAALDTATTRLLSVLDSTPPPLLGSASLLSGWSRSTIVAHLRYVATATRRMSQAALAGRSEAMYPAGRSSRDATLRTHPAEDVMALVRSLRRESEGLHDLWSGLSPHDWRRTIDEPELGVLPLTRLLVLRLTEVELHSTDHDLPGLESWSDVFVEIALPLRIAWLARFRRRADADLSCSGSWLLTDGTSRWLVEATGAEVAVEEADTGAKAGCTMAGERVRLLALLLGRLPAERLNLSGDIELAIAFKRAFPGP
jgi:hypothetical protein